MKVAVVNRSDTQGGAAVVSLRLVNALRKAGITANLLVTEKETTSPTVSTIGNKFANKFNFLAERAEIFARNGWNRQNLFAIDTGSFGTDISRNSIVKDADVVVLNWINQGTMSLGDVRELTRIGKPVVWVMHDMWNCTGVCHHAHDCTQYLTQCTSCPLLGGNGELALSTWKRKEQLYSNTSIRFVAVSNWLADVCRRSSLMGSADISVINNPFPIEDFEWQPLSDIPQIPKDKKVIVMGARRLDEYVKGFDILLELLQYIAREKPALSKQLHLLLYGDIRDHQLLDQIPVSFTYLGKVAGNDALNRIYRNAHIVISTSRYENLPGTLIEGASSGCIPVSFLRGGQDDIITHKANGYLAKWQDISHLAQGIEWALTAPISREELHTQMSTRFNAQNIASQYISLFEELISTNK